MIALIDSGLGNLSSIRNALTQCGSDVRIVSSASELKRANGVILPGVGSFGDAMDKLRQANWIEALDDEVRGNEMPFLGICLGMQVLASHGLEGGDSCGLGWIDGTVERIEPATPTTRLPHMGWNDVSFEREESGMSAGLNGDSVFYFMHSFSIRTSSQEVVKGVTDYSGPVTACLEMEHIWATQFHPEKSQRAGLRVLKNFVRMAEERR